jgi:predicted secreted protein
VKWWIVVALLALGAASQNVEHDRTVVRDAPGPKPKAVIFSGTTTTTKP